MTDCKTTQALETLSTQLLSQRVVFFVGAGFSLDTEGLKTDKIMASLLCRFLSLTCDKTLYPQVDTKALRSACNQLFGLKIDEAQLEQDKAWFRPDIPKLLSAQYYKVNQWMIRSFEYIYSELAKNTPSEFANRVLVLEVYLKTFRQDYVNGINDRQKVITERNSWLWQSAIKALSRFLALTDDALKYFYSAARIRLRRELCQQLGIEDYIKTTSVNKLKSWTDSAVVKKLESNLVEVNTIVAKENETLASTLQGKKIDETTLLQKIEDIKKSFHPSIISATSYTESDLLVAFNALNGRLLADLNADAGAAATDKNKAVIGKVVFLETVGIGSPQAMASSNPDLRPRYRVFGQLAMEGLLPAMVTTNYDMLIESGYRAVGLPTLVPGSSVKGVGHLPKEACLIAQPADFFQYSASLNATHIVKVHGCAELYRSYRQAYEDATMPDDKAAARNNFCRYLDSIVYTYREIQNWRDDKWSRDYLQTLLRSRAFVFCGYSGADPVMHNTIRSIYEEMGRKTESENTGNEPTAFSTVKQGTIEFETFEILNSASTALGRDVNPHAHQDYIGFHYDAAKYPCCDMVFRALMHRVTRKVQLSLLTEHLPELALMLFGKPQLASQMLKIITDFEGLINEECQFEFFADNTKGKPLNPAILEGQLAWTEGFHQHILRLYRSATMVRHFSGAACHPISEDYVPLRQNPIWSCFGIVLELAIRKALEILANNKTSTLLVTSTPTVGFFYDPNSTYCLEYHLSGVGPFGLEITSPSLSMATRSKVKRVVYGRKWQIDPEKALWPSNNKAHKYRCVRGFSLPGINIIWQFALGDKTITHNTVSKYFDGK